MIFVDASAIVAVLSGEPAGEPVLDCLETGDGFITSPVAVYESTLAIARTVNGTLADAASDVGDLLARASIRTVPIEPAETDAALIAFDRFGKGRHTAALNMGDCFAYAVARAHNAAILFVGDNFSHTDLTNALGAKNLDRP